ncbi:MAG: chorismate mutase [Methanomicrobiales archaeon]|nr:chorismate mutase [Methanomicrobiales archaeon]
MSLEGLRGQILEIDEKIIGLIAQRQRLAGMLAPLKQSSGLPIHDEIQKARVLDRVFDIAVESSIDPTRVQEIFEILIAMSEERQRECSGDGNLP